jgi:hypothetical protein
VCFLDGHVRAFAHWQAVPQRMLYDNLKPAVTKVLVGAERELSGRFESLASHYLFEPCFARPATGHDKGGVEARGKGIRWQHLVPIPSGPDFDAISRALLSRLDCDAVEERFVEERAHMLPLPTQPFRAAAMRVVTVSRRSLVQLEGAVYSVPSRWAELEVKAYIGADRIEVEGPDGRIEHARKHFGGRSVDYRHYVRELARKPQAVRQVADELIRDLGEPFGSTWRRLVDEHGPKQGARVFAQVLRALEDHGHRHVVERLQRALVDDEPVLLALRAGAPTPEAPRSEWLPPHLKQVDVQSGRAADYDVLLRGAP